MQGRPLGGRHRGLRLPAPPAGQRPARIAQPPRHPDAAAAAAGQRVAECGCLLPQGLLRLPARRLACRGRGLPRAVGNLLPRIGVGHAHGCRVVVDGYRLGRWRLLLPSAPGLAGAWTARGGSFFFQRRPSGPGAALSGRSLPAPLRASVRPAGLRLPVAAPRTCAVRPSRTAAVGRWGAAPGGPIPPPAPRSAGGKTWPA